MYPCAIIKYYTMINDYNTATEAVIYLKNGKRKYGLLIENEEIYQAYRFIPNEKIMYAGNYTDFIEFVSTDSIEAIDVNLK